MNTKVCASVQFAKSGIRLQRLLRIPGIHWIATRLGGQELRRLSFDEKFRSGDWTFPAESPDLVALVERCCNGGHILALGCGTAQIVDALAPETYQSIVGIDISREAIAIASARATSKAHFEVSDMVSYCCSRLYDVILFPDSLNYAPWFARKKMLRKLCGSLTTRGQIVVVITHPDRYRRLLEMIRRNFRVELDRTLQGSTRHVLVFA